MKIYDLPTLTILRFSNHAIVCFKLWWYASERLYFLWTYTLHLMMILYHPINPKLDLDPNPKWKVAPICTWKQLWKDRSKSNDRTGGSKLYYIKLSERVFIMWQHIQPTQIILHKIAPLSLTGVIIKWKKKVEKMEKIDRKMEF